MMLRLVILIAIADVTLGQVTRGSTTWFCMRKEESGCKFTGYAPGGNVSDVGQINAPTAKLHQNAMSDIFNRGSQVGEVAGAAVAVLELTGKVAPYMGPVVGVFAAATSLAVGEMTPTPDDILDSVNNAISELTYEMNQRLDQMKGYVDTQIINLHESLLRDDYKEMWRGWLMCAKKPNKEDSDSCQEREFDDIYSNMDRFTKYENEMKNGRTITPKQIRELEAKLPSSRDYANLLFMVLKALVDNYKNQKTGSGPAYYKLYSEYLKSSATTIADYASKAVETILTYHTGDDALGDCKGTLDCGGVSAIEEGFFNTHTADWSKCTCTIDDGTKTVCSMKAIIRTDNDPCDENNANWYLDSSTSIRTGPAFAKYIAKKLVKTRAKKFVASEIVVAESYWKQNLLTFVPAWRKAINYGKPGAAAKVDKKMMDSVRQKSKKQILRARAARK